MGYGAWPLSYDDRPAEADAIAVLHRAVDAGVRLIDTSDAYCKDETEKHHNERLIRRALDSYPNQTIARQVIVATKGICVRPEGRWERCATAEQIERAIKGSHEALSGGTRPIDLWQIHWCQVQNGKHPNDKIVPMSTLLGPVIKAIEQGVVRFVGLSNCTVAQIQETQQLLPAGKLISVQNRLNITDRTSERNGVLQYCQDNELSFLPWSPLGGAANAGGKGLLTDAAKFPNLNRIAAAKQCSPAKLMLAYMRTKWPCIVHISSARREAHLLDSLNQIDLCVTKREVQDIDSDGDQGEGTPPWVLQEQVLNQSSSAHPKVEGAAVPRKQSADSGQLWKFLGAAFLVAGVIALFKSPSRGLRLFSAGEPNKGLRVSQAK